jgi:hypothetical protein
LPPKPPPTSAATTRTLCPRHVEDIGEKVANDARDLRRQGQSQRTTPTIVIRETGPILDGERRLTVEPETPADPHRSRRHFRSNIAARELAHRQ